MSSKILTFPSEAEWKAARNGWVGASEVATLLRIPVVADEKKNPGGAWSDEKINALLAVKRGGPPEEDQMKWRLGHFLEPFILAEYLRAHPDRGGCMASCEKDTYIVHAHESGALAATPDAWVWDLAHPENRWPLQEKAYSEFTKSWFKDGPPAHLEAQCQAEMFCCDTQRASWVALIGNSALLDGDVVRADPETEGNIVALCEAFMCRVKEGQEVVS